MKRVITDSLLKAARRCPRLYYLRYCQELVPVRTAVPLRWGSLAHELIGGLYELARDHSAEDAMSLAESHLHQLAERWLAQAQAQAQEVQAARPYQLEADLVEETRKEAEAIASEAFEVVRHYSRTQWRKDLERWLVLWVEEPFEVPLPARNDTRHPWLVYRGRWDLVVQDVATGEVLLVDHKFTTRELDSFATELDSDTQGQAYLYAATVLATLPDRLQRQTDRPTWPGTLPPPGGFLHNVIRRTVPQPPHLLKNRRQPTLSTARSLVTTEALYWAEIKRHGLDPADYAEVLDRLHRHPLELVHRRQPNIGPEELAGWTQDVTLTAKAVKAIDSRGQRVAARHPGACRQIARRCPYIPLCFGQAGEEPGHLFRREVAHVELVDGWEEEAEATG